MAHARDHHEHAHDGHAHDHHEHAHDGHAHHEHAHDAHHEHGGADDAHGAHAHHAGQSLRRLAAVATLHCLTGCAIGEVLGMVIGTAIGLSNAATIALAVTLAFLFGYSLTMVPLLRSGLALGVAVPLAFASDSFSIAVMELVDNGVMLAVPGAMDAPLSNPLFWGALAFALAVAYVVAFPVNYRLISRGQGHAVVHQFHGHGPTSAAPPALDSRRLIATGVAAMAVTIGVATAGAAWIEGGHDEDAPMAGGHGTAAGDAHGDEGGRRAALGGLAVATAGYRLEAPTTAFVAGRATPFRFAIVGDRARVRRFDVEGGVRMHLIVVRRDLTGYQHLHPAQRAGGHWETPLTLAEPGVYRAYADFERDGRKTVLATDLFVAGDFAPVSLPAPVAAVDAGGYRVELDAHAEADAEATLAYRITRGGRPVTPQPYLGAAGHLVALREGDLAYLHVHPLDAEGGDVRFAATFPTPGRYRLFLQFKHEGRVRTAPLTIAVDDGH